MPPKFDDIFSKFKSSTKQAADQMGKAAKVARLKMDILTFTGEKTKHLQTIGDRTYELFCEGRGIDGSILVERVRHELMQIERIEGKIRELENQIADLQAMTQNAEVTDADEVTELSDPPNPES